MKIGIDIGGSHIAIGLVDNSEILQKESFFIKKNDCEVEEYIIESICNGIYKIMNDKKVKVKEIELIGIASPGNVKNGIIENFVNLKLSNFKIIDELKAKLNSEYTNIKIVVKNDGKCAALAEKKYGVLKEYEDCTFLCVGTGIGGAEFMQGKLLEPKKNSGFEFGHMIIKKDGERCNCGSQGCFEVYCSKKRLKEQILKILNEKEYLNSEALIKKINENKQNTEIKTLIDEYIKNFTIGLSNIVNIFEPEAICIGGSLAHYEDLIFEDLRKSIYESPYLFNKKNPPKILAAKEGNDAGIIGATIV